MSEIVKHSADATPEVISFIEANEYLNDPITRRDHFEHMDGDGFIDFLQQNASLVRTGGGGVMQSFDGEKVGLAGHEVPDQREKEALLRETWDVAQVFLKDRKLSDDDALERAALAVAGGVLLAHPFIDGNGRTSRLSSLMIARGNVAEETLSDILGKSSGYGGWEVSPITVSKHSEREYSGNQPDGIDWEDQLAWEGEDALGGIIVDSLFRSYILREFIEKHGDVVEPVLAGCTKIVDGSQVLDGDKFLADVVNQENGGITSAQDILQIHRKVRADYVHRYLRGLLSETPVAIARHLQPRPQEEGGTLHPRDAVAREFVGKFAVQGKLTPIEQQVLRHRMASALHHSEPSSTGNQAVA